MTEYVQVHYLTPYLPSNPNRDDLGRPKSMDFGGVTRQRISSQSLKRAWRTSPVFQEAIDGSLGVRTKDVYGSVYGNLVEAGVPDKRATEVAKAIGEAIGSQEVTRKKGEADGGKGAVLVFLTHHEKDAIQTATKKVIGDHDADITAEVDAITNGPISADVALFGRMIAKNPALNIEAATQVLHAFTVHEATFDVDYWTGVGDEDPWFDAAKSIQDAGKGAAMVDARHFGGGIFYGYVCINKTQLAEQMESDEAAENAIKALTKAVTLAAPEGYKSNFAQTPRAEYVLVERGEAQPRNLAYAFAKPLPANAGVDDATKALLAYKQRIDESYGDANASTEYGTSDGTEPIKALYA